MLYGIIRFYVEITLVGAFESGSVSNQRLASSHIRVAKVVLNCLLQVPVMLMSSRCHLKGLSRSQLVARGEEATEKGGYFIVKGSEKV